MRDAPWPRVVMHADMDAFYAAIEQLDHPELRGKPVLVGGAGQRSVVSTASYEARPFGVGSAMPMAIARRKCPEAIIVPPRMGRYMEVSQIVMGVLSDFSPKVEPLSLDEAFCDMTGAERLFGPPEAMGTQVKAAVFEATGGLHVSVGVAPTKFTAKVGSDFRKPDGLTVVAPDEVESFLHPQPISRVWGVGPKSVGKFLSLGLATMGDVARADDEFLERHLGSLGLHAARLARGIDNRLVVADRSEQSVSSEMTLSDDVVGAENILPVVRREADTVARRLRKGGLMAGGVRVKLKTSDFRIWTRQCEVHPPSDSAEVLIAEAEQLLQQFDLARPFRLIGIGAFRLQDADTPVQAELFGQEERARRRRLDRAVDEVRERYDDGLRRGSELE